MSEHGKLTRALALQVLVGVAGILAIATQPDPADLARVFLTVLFVAAVGVAFYVIVGSIQYGLIVLSGVWCRSRARRRAARRGGYLFGGPR